jgi:5-methylcytosine-specific restriction protein B
VAENAGIRQAAKRSDLLLKTALEILRDAGTRTARADVLDEIQRRMAPTPGELYPGAGGKPWYESRADYVIGAAATLGWASKIGGWSITDAGIEALDTYPDARSLHAEWLHLCYEAADRRKLAKRNLSDVQPFIATLLQLVEPGNWTTHEDLAALAGTSAREVADFLASPKGQVPNAHRLLLASGTIPPDSMIAFTSRGKNPRQLLENEGVEFDESGRAAHSQRLTAEALTDLLEERREVTAEAISATKRAWMVRGTNVDGYNFVPEWLSGGFVSLSASQLGHLDAGIGYDVLKAAVETAYQHKSYAYRGQRLEELDRFVRKIQVGDLVATPMHGELYLGEVVSDARFVDEGGPLDALRREVAWLDRGSGIDASQLSAPVPALLQSQSYVVDLTEAYDQLAALVSGAVYESAGPVRAIEKEQRTLRFHPVTTAAAADLLMEQAELQQIADLLWERKQVIFYGPPGTGKTYLAKALARHLTEDGAVRLVQFHPSYTYEDFFEGFRPKSADGGSGALTFELTPGPFRLFAEAAKANPSTAYILVIDEINRANLAKVFGELYFLLEYRDEAISLQYSPKEEFTLPENLFVIGTMNTADRSIARIDTAMRRRFAFIELAPGLQPVQGLLARWLEKRGLPDEAARLLDLLNSRLADADVAIGPSYLMKPSVYARADGLDRVWKYEISPLLEDLFYGQPDLAAQYGLESLRAALGASPL